MGDLDVAKEITSVGMFAFLQKSFSLRKSDINQKPMIGNTGHHTRKNLNQTERVDGPVLSAALCLRILWPDYPETFGHRHPSDWSTDVDVFARWVCPARVSRHSRSLGQVRIDRFGTSRRDHPHHPWIPMTSSSESIRCIHRRSSSSEYSQYSDVEDWHVVHTARSFRCNHTWEHLPWDSRNNGETSAWMWGVTKARSNLFMQPSVQIVLTFFAIDGFLLLLLLVVLQLFRIVRRTLAFRCCAEEKIIAIGLTGSRFDLALSCCCRTTRKVSNFTRHVLYLKLNDLGK